MAKSLATHWSAFGQVFSQLGAMLCPQGMWLLQMSLANTVAASWPRCLLAKMLAHWLLELLVAILVARLMMIG